MKQHITPVHSMHLAGLAGTPVDIEVDCAPGLPQCIMVGLPDASVFEARDRVRTAMKNVGFRFPPQRITVNLAPAHVKKAGSHYDLGIAIGILAAANTWTPPVNCYFFGELGLDGSIRGVTGALGLVTEALKQPNAVVVIAEQNAVECALLHNASIRYLGHLSEVIEALQTNQVPGRLLEETSAYARLTKPEVDRCSDSPTAQIDMADIIGQHHAKRAAEIAAAGGHHLLLGGPPGTGKTMLANALVGIVPPLSLQEQIETTMLHSLRVPITTVSEQAPFRAPHHTASTAAIIGGGMRCMPGEISLAHNGILFFDELPEFHRDALEALRQPLESGTITITRAAQHVRYPARFQLVGAYNPCPCGFALSQDRACTCTMQQLLAYKKKLSGPLLDRFDLKIVVPTVDTNTIVEAKRTQQESSADIRTRVVAARAQQYKRQQVLNSTLATKQVQRLDIAQEAERILHQVVKQKRWSMRGYIKTVRVARTIADLQSHERVELPDMTEAVQYTQMALNTASSID